MAVDSLANIMLTRQHVNSGKRLKTVFHLMEANGMSMYMHAHSGRQWSSGAQLEVKDGLSNGWLLIYDF